MMAPGRLCGLSAFALGDEGEGECLALAAQTSERGRCQTIAALLNEIKTTNNDVVISLALQGVVKAFACDDVELLWASLPDETAAHARQLVAAAAVACRQRKQYSLGMARSFDGSFVPPMNVLQRAKLSRCAADIVAGQCACSCSS